MSPVFLKVKKRYPADTWWTYFSHLTKLEQIVLHRWPADDAAMWDNRSTAHYVNRDTATPAGSCAGSRCAATPRSVWRRCAVRSCRRPEPYTRQWDLAVPPEGLLDAADVAPHRVRDRPAPGHRQAEPEQGQLVCTEQGSSMSRPSPGVRQARTREFASLARPGHLRGSRPCPSGSAAAPSRRQGRAGAGHQVGAECTVGSRGQPRRQPAPRSRSRWPGAYAAASSDSGSTNRSQSPQDTASATDPPARVQHLGRPLVPYRPRKGQRYAEPLIDPKAGEVGQEVGRGRRDPEVGREREPPGRRPRPLPPLPPPLEAAT
jgi:hypothetical protein